jgi:hypothetical protein
MLTGSAASPEIPAFSEPEGSSPYPQAPATCPYPEPTLYAGINNVIYIELHSGPKMANGTCGKTIVAGAIDRDSTVFLSPRGVECVFSVHGN